MKETKRYSLTPLIITSAVTLLVTLAMSFVMSSRGYRTATFDTPSGRLEAIHLFNRDARDAPQNEPHLLTLTCKGAVPEKVEVLYGPDRKEWKRLEMARAGDTACFAAELPPLPKGKRWFYRFSFPETGAVFALSKDKDFYVTFEGKVPKWLLVAHIALMIIAALLFFHVFHFSLEVLVNGQPALKTYWAALLGVAVFTVTAFGIGPFISGYVFGEPFGAWPFGHDITDTKSFYLILFWLVPLFLKRSVLSGGGEGKGIGDRAFAWWCLAALAVSLVVFAIPHSLFIQK